MSVRFAQREDLDRVNELRKQVNDLHVEGKPEVFKPGFPNELRDFIHTIVEDPSKRILVCERGGIICGFAVLSRVVRPETPFKLALDYLDIDEFGVDEPYRRQGVASEMIEAVRGIAKDMGLSRIELNMWEFNRDALAFYEAVGFRTYRRYLEMKL